MALCSVKTKVLLLPLTKGTSGSGATGPSLSLRVGRPPARASPLFPRPGGVQDATRPPTTPPPYPSTSLASPPNLLEPPSLLALPHNPSQTPGGVRTRRRAAHPSGYREQAGEGMWGGGGGGRGGNLLQRAVPSSTPELPRLLKPGCRGVGAPECPSV